MSAEQIQTIAVCATAGALGLALLFVREEQLPPVLVPEFLRGKPTRRRLIGILALTAAAISVVPAL